MAEPWIILDRDGVINVDRVDYIKTADEWQAIPGSIEAIGRLCTAGFKIAVATNQSGIGRGLMSVMDLENIHKKMDAQVESRGGMISGIFYCPHRPEDACNCRKPKTGLLDEIERQFAIDLTRAPFVGDSECDIQAAIAKGCEPILVRTGKGEATSKLLPGRDEYKAVAVYDDLASYVQVLLSKST